MLDIKFIRQNTDKIKECCKNRNYDPKFVDQVLDLDKKRRELINKRDETRAKHSGTTSKVTKKESVDKELIKRGKEEKERIKTIEIELKGVEENFTSLMCQLPNLLCEGVPIGKDDSDNVVLRTWGKKPEFSFNPKDYLEISEKLGLVDIESAAKASGTRFGYIKGKLVLMEIALINFAFDILTKEDFIPILPPVMLKSKMAKGMGYLEQTDKEEAYYLPKDDLYLIGTAEQSIGVMHADDVFQEKELPKRYAGFSTCFRREAGAYGKDTKGILRVHQFDKIEMFSFCHPSKSKEEHLFLLSMEEKLMQALKVPYQVIQMCTADIALPQAAKFDIETWMPGQNQYRETHSTSTCTDFQARRLNIRYRDSRSKKLEFVHTLNGTAFAIGRTLIAITENYQQKDGSVKVPDVLQKYVNFKVIK